ncbi:MAG: DNA alkylation repair protein [Ignavibacteriae bacterium]|nr:DNA alkylation repair protein [Ignavibacteriota bacterium]
MAYKEILDQLTVKFEENANTELAKKMAQYMRNLFPFYGIQKQNRAVIAKPFLKELVKNSSHDVIAEIALTLWNKPQREYHYFCMEYVEKVQKLWQEHITIQLFENLIVTKSWWDSVDFIASHLVGKYFQKWDSKLPAIVDNWNTSDNMWLNRTAIIYQLSYKEKTDTDILTHVINTHSKSKVFFIQKAIGWALRQYGYANPEFVRAFVQNHALAPLSKREALKNL